MDGENFLNAAYYGTSDVWLAVVVSAIMRAAKDTVMQIQQSLIGTWRRFGVLGPVYEIVGEKRELENGDHVMRVRLVETGEEIDYKLTDILDDPKER